MSKKYPKKQPVIDNTPVSVIPIEKGINDKGVPFVKAMVTRSEPTSSKKLRTTGVDISKKAYKDHRLLEPYIKSAVLDEFLVAAPTHGICVAKKARMVAGLGLKVISKIDERSSKILVRRYDAAYPEKKKTLDEKEYQEAKKNLGALKLEREKLGNFIEDANDDTTLISIIERAWSDYESHGNLNLEVLRDDKDGVSKLNHIPSSKLKVVISLDRFAYFPSASMIKPIYFKRYGDPRHLNSSTGEFREWKGELNSDSFDAGKDWGAEEANEIIRYVCYSSRDMAYGIPSWYGALADMIGGIESRDFMLRFFSEKAVPLYAVLLEGGSWDEETIRTIQNFFRRELTGNYHATLALEIPTGGKITFEQISPEPRWWPFILKYRDAVRDIIVSCHGLTPAIVGVIAQTGIVGSGSGGDQMEMVKAVEIKPRQEVLEWLFNRFIVKEGLGLTRVKAKFDEIDTVDEQINAQMVSSLYATPSRPAITTNEARKFLRLEPVESEWADQILILDPQFGLLPMDDLSEAVRQKQKADQIAMQSQGVETQPQNQVGSSSLDGTSGSAQITPKAQPAQAPTFEELTSGLDMNK